MRTKTCITALALGVLLCGTSAYGEEFRLRDTLDLSNTDIFGAPLFDNASPYGTNPSAVTTDGSSLWVAGFNGGTGSTAGIVRIADPWGSPAAAQVASYATPGSRGFSGLAYDYNESAVLAAYDKGSADANGITGWHPATDAPLWARNARGGSGVGDDPGFGGVDRGAGWTTFGSGRRALQDSASGGDIYTTADGMVILTAEGSFWRDMDFNAASGDIWLREGNNVIAGTRTGGNSVTDLTVVYDEPTDADFVAGQNIAYLDSALGGDLVIYNSRTSTATGQLFSLVVNTINPDGSAAGVPLLQGNGAPLEPLFAQGAAYYDFEWYAPRQELLISDFSNRMVYRFELIPEPASLSLLGFGALTLLRRRRG